MQLHTSFLLHLHQTQIYFVIAMKLEIRGCDATDMNCWAMDADCDPRYASFASLNLCKKKSTIFSFSDKSAIGRTIERRLPRSDGQTIH